LSLDEPPRRTRHDRPGIPDPDDGAMRLDQNPCSLIGSRLDAGLRAIGTDLSTVSVDELKDAASRSIAPM
jgi:hypothetical protein